jgi:hypothetical protein
MDQISIVERERKFLTGGSGQGLPRAKELGGEKVSDLTMDELRSLRNKMSRFTAA